MVSTVALVNHLMKKKDTQLHYSDFVKKKLHYSDYVVVLI